MASAKQFLTVAIADNRSQIEAISDVADRSEAGVDPKLLVENLISELAKAAARATKLEKNFVEKTRELDTIRNSLNKSESVPGPTRSRVCQTAGPSMSFFAPRR